ncbi:unnamed protein product [Mesocestoides corti]|uniref:Endo/exonuclease/phosphatase domain-containing protein n=1 Tax=Mesocestoides corti TaxID=53468 RepID=A0A158QUM9_MESCO|nr:unnamed protein product [Mesocestoides corti]
MLQLITRQLGVSVSTKYLDDNKISPPQRQLLCDLTNTLNQATEDSLAGLSMKFEGNPLDLEEVCNLSVIDSQLTLKKTAAVSGMFNYSSYKQLKPTELPDAFSTYGEGTLFLTSGAAGGAPQLVALLPGTSNDSRRLLRAYTIQNPDMELKVSQLETRFMPFSNEVSISYEATYSFSFSVIHVDFTCPTGGLLSHPQGTTIGHVTTQISPFSTAGSPLSSIKIDLDRIKRLSIAYQNEAAWIPIGDFNADALECSIVSHLTNGKRDIQCPSGLHVLRDLDSTERTWEALKDVPDRKLARQGFLLALRRLQDNISLLSIGSNNFTRFAKLSRSCVALRGGEQSQFEVTGLRMLLEAGIYKATNDCLAVIRSVSPYLEKAFVSMNFTDNMSLEKRLLLLFHLYKVGCMAAALSSVIQASVVETEIRPLLLDTKTSKTEFPSVMETDELELDAPSYTHTCTTPLTHLIPQLGNFTPDIWIVRFSASKPVKTEKHLVYECLLSSDGSLTPHCHVLELVDTVWYPDS